MGTIEQRFRGRLAIFKETMGQEYVNEDNVILPVTVIENTDDARDEYLKSEKAGGCDDQLVILTPEHIEALKNGKVIAISPEKEYDVFIVLKA